MHYDQSWMGYGIVGGLQAGAISVLAGCLLFALIHWLGGRQRWSLGAQLGWSFLLATLLSAGGDLWDMFYLNYAQLQSLPLLQAKLAQMHDPDGLGTRVWCELSGVVLGIGAGWLLCQIDWRRVFRRRG
ncbi:MAG: hypothetical protein EPN74_08430 [Rhodanobacter sp.]|nr:MAG: hypothetical protein EPN74_08430 [Rhodanobacter sp.]